MGQRYPLPMPSVAPANPHAAKPRAIPADWQGGDFGDDVDESSANTPNIDLNGNAVANYGPRNQDAKATLLGVAMAKDIARSRGTIDPRQPYPVAGDPAVAAPTVASIVPNSVATNGLLLIATLTGTGFTKWTEVRSASGARIGLTSQYRSPTIMQVLLDPTGVPPATYQVQVIDHDVESNSVPLTVTA